jgi:uncharacterized protein (TIGR03083 family)
MAKSSGAAPEEILGAVEAEMCGLESYLAALSDADLERPSACTGWTIADVVAHLTTDATGYIDLIEQALRGDTAAPSDIDPSLLTPEGLAEFARSTRRQMGARVREELRRANGAALTLLRRLSPEDWGRRSWHPVGTVTRIVQLHVVELALHGWDIRSAYGHPAHLTDTSLPQLFDYVRRGLRWRFIADPTQPRPMRLRFGWVGAVQEPQDLVVGAGEARLTPSGEEPPDATIRCNPEVFVLLATARIDSRLASASYGTVVSGDSALVESLRTRFRAL